MSAILPAVAWAAVAMTECTALAAADSECSAEDAVASGR